MYLIGSELMIQTKVSDREREVGQMTPRVSRPRRAALRAILAGHLAHLAMRIDQDAAETGSGAHAVDFRASRPS
jgi:hypothetical protein